MNWGVLLGTAQKIGWTPDVFWKASMWEFTTAVWAEVEKNMPADPGVSDDDLAAFFRSQPGHVKKAVARG